MFLVITARFKNLRGKHGTRWAILCALLFPVLFCLGFVHPVLWGVATLALEAYIITSCVREWRGRSAQIHLRRADAIRLGKSADLAEQGTGA